jgi:DNA-binding GntR family transcriptional regulator
MAGAMEKLEKYLAEYDKADNGDSRLLREVAYERLQDAILHAGLQPGDPLSETRISKALGISRTPVREALQQLAQDGLLQIIPGRAITVAAPSMQEVFDALHVRELLEPEVIRMAAESLPAYEREALQHLTGEMEQAARAGDRRNWSKLDIKWHEILCNSCPNHLLGQLVIQARNRIYSKGADEHVTDQFLIHGTLEHKEIVEAIVTRDSEKAQQLMLEHLRHVRDNMFKRLGRY